MGQIWALCTSHARHDVYKVDGERGDSAEPGEQPKVYSWDKRMPADAKNFIVDGLEDGTEVRLHGQISGQQFVIKNCKNSILLLLDYSASITIDDCFDCTIIIGPCRGSVFSRDCKNLTILAACQQFRATDCDGVKAWLHCVTVPTLESSKGVKLGCLQLHYDELLEHLNKVELTQFNSKWSAVHDFTPAKGNWSLMNENLAIGDLQKLYISLGDDMRKSGMTFSMEKSDIPWTIGKRTDADKKYHTPALTLCFGTKSLNSQGTSSISSNKASASKQKDSANSSLISLRNSCLKLSKLAQNVAIHPENQGESNFESIKLDMDCETDSESSQLAKLLHSAELEMDSGRLERIMGCKEADKFKDRLKHCAVIGMEWRLRSTEDESTLRQAVREAFSDTGNSSNSEIDENEHCFTIVGEKATEYLTRFWHEANVQFSV